MVNYRGTAKPLDKYSWTKEEYEELHTIPHEFSSDPEHKGWMIVRPHPDYIKMLREIER